MHLRTSALLIFCLATSLHADSAQDVHTLFENAAAALTNHQSAAFLAFFDSGVKLKSSVEALLKTSDTVSTIEWEKNDGDDRSRTVQLNWLLDITERNGAAALTHRRAPVRCTLVNKNGQWRITSFTPADFFALPQAGDAWLVVAGAAEGLTEADAASSVSNPDIAAVNARKFLEAFDSAMSGYARLKDDVLAMGQRGDIESSVDLLRNEGDDRARSIEVEWTLNLVAHDTGISVMMRTENVTLRVEKKGKNWRITDLQPRSLFAPPGAGNSPLY